MSQTANHFLSEVARLLIAVGTLAVLTGIFRLRGGIVENCRNLVLVGLVLK
jgi:hypothetical protein